MKKLSLILILLLVSLCFSQPIGPRMTKERLEDYIGAMLAGIETLISVSYDDANSLLDFVVDEANIDHDALTNFLAAEHIDWTASANDLTTSGDANIGGDAFITGDVGIGTGSPDSVFHIKADVSGSVGSDPAGQLIIQNPTDTVFSNAVITGYESDANGNPDQQLWYLGSASGGNSDITFLNRRNSKLSLGTNDTSRIIILGNGDIDFVAGDLTTTGDIITGGITTGNFNGVITVDGHTYDQNSVGIQAAIDALDANGGTIILPAGEYLMYENGANNYCVLVDKPVWFKGLGAGNAAGAVVSLGTKLKLAANQDCGMFEINETGDVYIYGCGFYNIEFDGNRDNNANNAFNLLNFVKISDVYIQNCSFNYGDIGTSNGYIGFDTDCLRAWITHCAFMDEAGGWGIVSISADFIFIDNNYWNNCPLGIWFDDAGQATRAAGSITNNQFLSVGYDPIRLSGTTIGVNIAGNTFSQSCSLNSAFACIRIKETVNRVNITGNMIASVLAQCYNGLMLEDGTEDYIYATGNDFSLANTPYNIFAGANASGGSIVPLKNVLTLTTDVYPAIKTVIKTIDADDDASTDDYQLDDDASNATEQVITLTSILPAYAEFVSFQIRCFETFGDSNVMAVDFGTSSGGAEIKTTADIDTANDILVTEATVAPELAAVNAADTFYVNFKPDDNWDDIAAASNTGRWAVLITYIDYGVVYTKNSQ